MSIHTDIPTRQVVYSELTQKILAVIMLFCKIFCTCLFLLRSMLSRECGGMIRKSFYRMDKSQIRIGSAAMNWEREFVLAMNQILMPSIPLSRWWWCSIN
jgi:hypothetical protein